MQVIEGAKELAEQKVQLHVCACELPDRDDVMLLIVERKTEASKERTKGQY